MATCSDGDSFYLSSDESFYVGCFEDSGTSKNGVARYVKSEGFGDGAPVVYASTADGEPARWKLATFNGSYLIKCWDAGWNDASILHPTEVAEWDCCDCVSVTDVTTTCGCSTPAPTAPESTPAPVTPLTPAPATPLNLTSAPTPVPATSMTPGTVMPSNFSSAVTPAPSTELTAPAALTAAPVVVDPPRFPLWTVIGGCVGGAALLAIAGVLVAKRRQDQKKNGSGSPPPSDGNAAVVPSVGSRNFPVVSNGGRKNYPIVPGGGGRNYPIVSEFGRANLPVV